MTWRRPIIAALALAALVAVYAAGEWAARRAAEREAARERLLPQDWHQVVRIEIENEDGVIELERGDEGWRLTQPLREPADQGQVRSLLGLLDSALVMSLFESAALEEYGLAPSAAAVHLTFQDGSAMRILVGGEAPQPLKVYAAQEGSGSVFLVNQAVKTTLQREVLEYRDKTILEAAPVEVTMVRLENAGGVMEARRMTPGGAWALTRPIEYPADNEKIDTLLRRLHINKLLAFVEDADAATTAAAWFDEPAATLTVQWRPALSDSPVTATLIAGDQYPVAKAWYAKRTDRGTAFLVGEEVFEELQREPDQFRDKSLFTLHLRDAVKIEMRLGMGAYTLVHDGIDWVFADDPKTRLHQSGVELFLENMLAMRAETFETDAPGPLEDYGLDPPRLLAIVYGKDGRSEGLAVGALSPEKNIVYVRKLRENVVLGLKWTVLSSIYKFREDLTDKRLLDKESADEVVRIVTREKGQTRILERRGDKCYLIDPDEKTQREVSPISALDYLTKFTDLQYHRRVPANEVTPADAQLDEPVFMAQLLDNSGQAVAVFEFGNMMDDKIFMRHNRETIFLMKLDDWKDLTTLFGRLGR